MNLTRLLRLCAILILGGMSLAAARAEPPAAFLGDVQSQVIESKTIPGRSFQISVALPLSYATSAARYPVIYALDANGEFGIVAETARMLNLENLVPDAIVVGIGYPTGGYFVYSMKRRETDYTPSQDPALLEQYKAMAAMGMPDAMVPAGNGDGRAFLGFIRDELIPWVDKTYRTKPDDRTLLGHSLGGLFAFHVAFTTEGLFQRYAIGSPALWWHDRDQFTVEKAYSKNHRALPARMFISIGGQDTERVKSAFTDMTAILAERHYKDLVLTTHVFEGETHSSVVPAFVSRGLRSVFAK